MRIEPEQVRALVKTLCEWGYTIEDDIEQELVDEFDVVQDREDPGQKKLGGFRRTDPDTSKMAAIAALPRTGSQRRKALEVVCHRDHHYLSTTSNDVKEATGIEGVWKRMSELKQGGWVKVVGTKKLHASNVVVETYRPTPKATEWWEKS